MENVIEEKKNVATAKEAKKEETVKKDYVELVGRLIEREDKVRGFVGKTQQTPVIEIDFPFSNLCNMAYLQPAFYNQVGSWGLKARKEILKAVESGESAAVEIRVKMYLKSYVSKKTHREGVALNFEVPNFTDDGFIAMHIDNKVAAGQWQDEAPLYLNPVK